MLVSGWTLGIAHRPAGQERRRLGVASNVYRRVVDGWLTVRCQGGGGGGGQEAVVARHALATGGCGCDT